MPFLLNNSLTKYLNIIKIEIFQVFLATEFFLKTRLEIFQVKFYCSIINYRQPRVQSMLFWVNHRTLSHLPHQELQFRQLETKQLSRLVLVLTQPSFSISFVLAQRIRQSYLTTRQILW